MNKKELYAKNLIEYILDKLGDFNIFPYDPEVVSNTDGNDIFIGIRFPVKYLGEPLKKSDEAVLNEFINETVKEYLNSTPQVPDKDPRYTIDSAFSFARKDQFRSRPNNWSEADTVGFMVFLYPEIE